MPNPRHPMIVNQIFLTVSNTLKARIPARPLCEQKLFEDNQLTRVRIYNGVELKYTTVPYSSVLGALDGLTVFQPVRGYKSRVYSHRGIFGNCVEGFQFRIEVRRYPSGEVCFRIAELPATPAEPTSAEEKTSA